MTRVYIQKLRYPNKKFPTLMKYPKFLEFIELVFSKGWLSGKVPAWQDQGHGLNPQHSKSISQVWYSCFLLLSLSILSHKDRPQAIRLGQQSAPLSAKQSHRVCFVFLSFVFIFNMYESFAYMHVCAPCVWSALTGQKRELELGLQMVLSCGY